MGQVFFKRSYLIIIVSSSVMLVAYTNCGKPSPDRADSAQLSSQEGLAVDADSTDGSVVVPDDVANEYQQSWMEHQPTSDETSKKTAEEIVLEATEETTTGISGEQPIYCELGVGNELDSSDVTEPFPQDLTLVPPGLTQTSCNIKIANQYTESQGMGSQLMVTLEDCKRVCLQIAISDFRNQVNCVHMDHGAATAIDLKQDHKIVRTNNLSSEVQKFSYYDYLVMYPDVAHAGVDPLMHYEVYGQRERRSPNILFDEGSYLAANTDVKTAVDKDFIVTGYAHHKVYGEEEGRYIYTRFDEQAYLMANQDVAECVFITQFCSSGLDHYILYGRSEGREFKLLVGRAHAYQVVY